MDNWTPLDAAIWTMGQLVWPALLLGAVIIAVSMTARDKRPLLFLSSLALSELLLIAAGLFERQLKNPTWLTLFFLAGQVGLLVFCAIASKRRDRKEIVLASLCFIYAVLTSFVASMGFTGEWL